MRFRYHLYLTFLRGFRSGHTKTSLLSYRDLIESEQVLIGYFPIIKITKALADQTAWMRRAVCAFVVRKSPKTGFLTSRPLLLRTVTVFISYIHTSTWELNTFVEPGNYLYNSRFLLLIFVQYKPLSVEW